MSTSGQVDSKVPRAKAAFHAALPALAFLLGPPAATIILGFTGLAMTLSVVGGPRFSLFGKLFGAIRGGLKVKPGQLEEAAPHRFAEAVGAVFLLASALSYMWGLDGLGGALALIVVGLAILNAAAGICVGCQMYLLLQKTRSRVTA